MSKRRPGLQDDPDELGDATHLEMPALSQGERVNDETPVAKLRWSIAHLNDASVDSLRRMKAMGIGWLMQNAFYFRGEAFLAQRGGEPVHSVEHGCKALCEPILTGVDVSVWVLRDLAEERRHAL